MGDDRRTDLGLTHVALGSRDIDKSVDFYARYARMKVVHERHEHTRVVWLSDQTRPFVIVLVQMPEVDTKLDGFAHLGVACESREEVDRLCALAQAEGRLRKAAHDWGYPVGYWAFIADPDGHNLEVSFGQEVGLAVKEA